MPITPGPGSWTSTSLAGRSTVGTPSGILQTESTTPRETRVRDPSAAPPAIVGGRSISLAAAVPAIGSGVAPDVGWPVPDGSGKNARDAGTDDACTPRR